MQITQDDICRFQEIWRGELGEELSEDDARHHIARLDALYLMFARRPKSASGVASVALDSDHDR